ncbi:MAG: hypothetical protein HKN63_03130 [Rhodobacteraceae bacterium]|nr:hypothetical protein [Paracoccaceae bacterium]
MPLPIAPIAGVALRYGAIALATYAVTRHAQSAPRDQRAEDAMDDVAEGVALRKEQGQMNGAGRFRRVIRLGTDGPGIEVDATALTRIRIRKLGD